MTLVLIMMGSQAAWEFAARPNSLLQNEYPKKNQGALCEMGIFMGTLAKIVLRKKDTPYKNLMFFREIDI